MTRTAAAMVDTAAAFVYLAIELGLDKWVLCFSDGTRFRLVTLRGAGCCTVANVLAEAEHARRKFRLPPKAKLVCCYEAGRHGFSVQRELAAAGAECLVVDSSSIEVPRRMRRNKTDRIDAHKLVRLLLRYRGGEKEALRVARVPTVEQEDDRRPAREMCRLKKERTALINRMRGLLMLFGVRLGKVKLVYEVLKKACQYDGSPLPTLLVAEVRRTAERKDLLDAQIAQINKERRARLHRERRAQKKNGGRITDRTAHKVLHIMQLCGIGEQGAWLLVTEAFGWRTFSNRRQAGGFTGIVPTVFASCTIERGQGMSKAGNSRVRWMMQELAWCWLRFQPDSKLSRWFDARFGNGSDAQRCIGAGALARRLFVELSRWDEHGIVPEGAVLRHERNAKIPAA